MSRLFAAIALPEHIRRELTLIAAGVPGARWNAPENMHLTLRFIGEVHGGHALDVASFLSSISVPAFSLSIKRVGVFGDKKRPRVLWAGLEPSEDLMRLNRKIEVGLQRMGFDPDQRKYHPHVTLAKLRNTSYQSVEQFQAEHAFMKLEPVDVTGFVLFQSHLSSQGSQYDPIAHYPLRSRDIAVGQEQCHAMV